MRSRILMLAAAAALAAPSAALADTKAGVDAWQRGDYATAIAEWRPRAIAGDGDAQFNLAQAYTMGRGVPVDLTQAELWLRKAADQGHSRARDNLGLIMFQNGKRNEALPLIEEAAGHGDPRAQYVFGTALFNGDLVAKDWVRAYALMTRASQSGIPAASASLAQMDRFIPLDQRTRGLALARAFEASSQRPLDSAGGTIIGGDTGTPATPRPVVVRPVPVRPPVAVTPPDEGVAEAPPPRPTRPAPTPKPPHIVAAPHPAPPPAPHPAPRPAPAPAVGGHWRVQLAALSEQDRARSLWQSAHARIGALGPYSPMIAQAGGIWRVQAGPLPSRAAAEALCAHVKAAGQTCAPIAP